MKLVAAALAATLLLSAAAVAAQPAPPLTREQALERLAQGDAEARAEAAAWLGDHGAMRDAPALVQALRDRDGVVRGLAENALWRVWGRSGDPEVDALFALGVEQMSQRAPRAAIETFTKIVDQKPDFAEGWNKRATIYYLIGEYEKSLKDCDEVMKRNPQHFGALSGYGQIYIHLEDYEKAIEYFRRAVEVNPKLTDLNAVIQRLEELVREKRGRII